MNSATVDGDPTASNALPPDPMIFCDEVKRRTTKADCDDLTNTARARRTGRRRSTFPTWCAARRR